MRKTATRAARIVFGLAGAGFLVVAFLQTWDRSQGLPIPAWWSLGAGLLLIVAGLVAVFRCWATLLDLRGDRRLAAGFFLAQLGKYVPGGVWQVVGQVGYATRPDRSLGRVATAFAAFALVQAAGAAVIGAAVSVLPSRPPGMLGLAGLIVVPLIVLLDRRWLARAVGSWRRLRGDDRKEDIVPGQGAIIRACAWSAACMLGMALAFAAILAGLLGEPPPIAAVPAFAMAWTIGFLALPFPSGLGVREAVLVALLGSAVGIPVLIAASISLRLLMMAAEVLLIVVTRGAAVAQKADPQQSPTRDEPQPATGRSCQAGPRS